MPELSRISEPVNARVEPGELDRRYIVVDVELAARLHTRHTRRFECVIRETPAGPDEFTRDVPNVGEEALAHLDDAGLIKLGTEVERGVILVGKVTPRLGAALSPEEKLLRAIFGEKAGDVVDSSLRCPPWCAGVVVDARIISGTDAIVEIAWERPLVVGDVLLIGGEPVVVADIRRLAADLAWTGGVSQVAVAKAATAVDVLHARSIGPYSSVTQQPLGEREQWGGQQLERAQLERLAAAAPWAAWELLTIKADAIEARMRAYESIVKGENPDVLPVPAKPPPTSTGDTFWFFEHGTQVEPGEVPTVAPEGVRQLQACASVLGVDLDLRKPEIGVGLLTPEQLRERSRGQVVDPDDLHSQKIFGPLRDYECECGKYRRMKHSGIVCEACGVEVTSATVRCQRFGHIELALRCRHPLLPEWTLDVVPVLPPGLRVGTDLDACYRALLEHDPSKLQAAVDQLGAVLVELGDRRFAELFSKPVDYSGIAQLVVDPSLDPGACRVPTAMLRELFRPHAYSLLEARGYVTTIKSAKRMLDQRRPEALWATEAASEGFPVLLMAGPTIVSRRVRAWDAPAIAVDPATARLLASFTVTVHVPLMDEAALQCAELDDDPQPRSTASGPGWLSQAREHGRFIASAVAAAQRGECEVLTDPLVALALGRVPTALDPSTRERWATQERERREQVWVRRAPIASPEHAPISHPHFARHVDELELTTALARALHEAGISTIGQLCSHTEASLLKSRGFGRKRLAEIKQILAELGLSLGMRDG
jgi:hypothetical protein